MMSHLYTARTSCRLIPTQKLMDEFWQNYQDAMARALRGVLVTAKNGDPVAPETALNDICSWVKSLKAADGSLLFIGNGASASFSSHMAADWAKNTRVRAMAFNDAPSITALANDNGFENSFSQPVKTFGRRGDLLVSVSSSGNSPNVLQAHAVAHDNGLRIITLSGMKPDNKSRRAGDLNFYVPAWSYGIVECAHQTILHSWIDRFMEVRDWQMQHPQIT